MPVTESSRPSRSAAPIGNDGHRARLRTRLLESGPDALADHELIESLLALARPRVDTKPAAKRLLAEFGSIGKLLAAPPAALARVTDVGESSVTAIKIVQAIALRAGRQAASEHPVLASWQALLDYLRLDMGDLGRERVRVLHLDSKNRLIRDEVMSEGSVDQSAIYVREVVKRALELESSALILVHNHPSGDTNPSRQDIAITQEIAEACKRFSIALHDHVIIGRDNHTSLRALGLI